MKLCFVLGLFLALLNACLGPLARAAAQDTPASDEVYSDGSSSPAPTREEERVRYRQALRTRHELSEVHRALGIATWASMGITLFFGGVQFHDLYNFQGIDSNPCVTGRDVILPEFCSGTPWPHAVSAGLTTALYTSTFALSLVMPNPDGDAIFEGEFGDRLRQHRILRWVHLAGMIAQLFLGFAHASHWFGLNRANDYDAMQALAITHMGIGAVTWGALTWAGALMVF